jgi:cyclase
MRTDARGDRPGRIPYERGLHELGDGLFAYLQPDGGWGWSNAGLITADGSSLLVDTLFDLRLTAEMLERMEPVLERSPLGAAVNTHANGDHCFGNQLLPEGIPLYGTSAAAEEMREVTPARVHTLFRETDLGPEFAAFARERFGAFELEGIELRPPTSTFDGSLELAVGDRTIELIELGPAHTEGDAIAHVPDAAAVFTGDLVFVEGTPIAWAGPVDRWLSACERILALGAQTIVPGHGPVTDAAGVRAVQRYLSSVRDQARLRFEAGMGPDEAADDIDLEEFAELGDPERIVVNVDTLYREFDPSRPPSPPPELFARMARWLGRHARRAEHPTEHESTRGGPL